MTYTETKLKGVWIIEPKVFQDERGYFFESWNEADFNTHIGKTTFVQDNESRSSYGVLRGLHYQKGDKAQAKLVRVIKGKVLYVAVELSEENKKQLFIPRGFAHGFVVLSPEAIFTYKVDNHYAPESEAGLIWNDATVGVEWGIDASDIIINKKDLNASTLAEAELFD